MWRLLIDGYQGNSCKGSIVIEGSCLVTKRQETFNLVVRRKLLNFTKELMVVIHSSCALTVLCILCEYVITRIRQHLGNWQASGYSSESSRLFSTCYWMIRYAHPAGRPPDVQRAMRFCPAYAGMTKDELSRHSLG